MASVRYGTPDSISSSLVTSELDSLADGSESALFTLDNSTNKYPYCALTIKLGSLTPATVGAIRLRVLSYDGTNTPDKIGGDIYVSSLISGTSAKVITFSQIKTYPFSMRLSITNNSGASFNAADNDVYVRFYDEATI